MHTQNNPPIATRFMAYSTSTADDCRDIVNGRHAILWDRRLQAFCRMLNMRGRDGTIGIVITGLKSRGRLPLWERRE